MIKSGYYLEINTWENDADSYATKSFDGLSYADCIFLTKLSKLFYSCHDRKSERGYGNSDTRNPDLFEAYRKLVEVHLAEYGVLPDGHGEYIEDDYIGETLYDFIGNWNEGEYWRVMESYKVHFIPENLIEVTEKFQ